MLARLRGWIARDPLLWGAFAVLWAASLFPIWHPRFLPLVDLPNQLAAIGVWRHYGDPAWGFSRFYELSRLPLPSWGYHAPVVLLSYLVPIEIANKLYLSAYALGLPVAAALLAQRMGRSPWYALFVFPLVFNVNFGYGFIAFCAGLTLALFALVTLDHFLEIPTRRAGAALVFLTLALYLTHLLPWLYFGFAAAVLLGCHGWHPRRMATAVLLLLPSVAVAIWTFRVAGHGHPALPASFAWDPQYQPLLQTMGQAPSALLCAWQDDRAYRLLLGLCAVWMILLLGARTDTHDSEARRHGFVYRLELVFALTALLVCLLPARLAKPVDVPMLGGRFVSVSLLLLFLLPHGAIVGRRKLWLVPVVALAIYYPIRLGQKWKEFDFRAASLRRLMTEVPRGSSTLTLALGDGDDPAVMKQASPLAAFHAYPQLLTGGFDPWALSTGSPMVRKESAALPAPEWRNPRSFVADEHALSYDYVLVANELEDYALFGPNDAVRFPLVRRDGMWRLYRVRHVSP
jgi:hypothetical protein